MDQALENIEIGSQVYVQEGDDPFGAVRDVTPSRREITVYVENAGELSSNRTPFVRRTMAKLSWTEHVWVNRFSMLWPMLMTLRFPVFRLCPCDCR